MKYLRILQPLALILASAIIFSVAYFSLNDDSFSDPKLNLLVSQAIVEHGTIYLDAYQEDEILGRPFVYYTNLLDILERDGHYFHYFPVGPSVLSVPFVAIARLFGMDMRGYDSFELQHGLSAISVMVLFFILGKIGRNLTLSPLASFTIAFLSILGSSLISTLGSALWSSNFTAIFFALTFYLITKPPRENRTDAAIPYAIGLLLFLAFFSRASAATFIAPLFVYLLWKNWRDACKTMLTAGVFLGLFLLWSRFTFGSWLPAYYATGRLQVERLPTYIGMIGNLISPSRGIFVFSPMWTLVVVGCLALWRKLWREPLFWLAIVWFTLNLWLTARAAKWYGGWSFGPRILTDSLIAWVLLTQLVWRELPKRLTAAQRSAIAVPFIVLSGFAIWINSYQGLYTHAASRWNHYVAPKPAIHTRHPWGDNFNWDYAQFRADRDMLCQIERDKIKTFLDAPLPIGKLQFGEWLDFREENIIDYRSVIDTTVTKSLNPVFVGFSVEEEKLRWTGCDQAEIHFEIDELVPDAELYTITLRAYGIRPGPVRMLLNGHELVDTDWDASTPTEFGEIFITAHFIQLNEFGRNHIRFELPEVTRVSWGDQRQLGIGFGGLKIEAIETAE